MKTRDAIALLVVAAVVLTAGAWFGLIAPQRAESARLDTAITTKQGELGQARTDIATFTAARTAYPENYETVARLGKALPESADVASLIEQLAETSRRTRVSFDGVSASDAGAAVAPAPAPAPGAVSAPEPRPFSFTFEGPFLRLSTFLDRFERYVRTEDDRLLVDGRLLTIDGFQMAVEGESAGVVATITATSYVVPDLFGGATPESPVPGAPAPAAAADGSPPPVPSTAVIGAPTP
jgi:hypothetical protein